MWTDLIDAFVELFAGGEGGALESSAMNSGSVPDAAATGAGSAGVLGGNTPGDETEGGGGGDEGGRRTRPRNTRDPDDPNYERDLQVDNAVDTGVGLVAEVATEVFLKPFDQLGKVLGPLATVVSATDVVTDGVSTVIEAGRIRDERVAEGTGDHFGDRARAAERAEAEAADERAAEQRAAEERAEAARKAREELTPEARESLQRAEDTLADIEFRRQAEEAAAARENERWSGRP